MILIILAIMFAFLGLCFWLEGDAAMKRPMRNDGIGGNDTDNLTSGCLSPIIAVTLWFVSVVIVLVGTIQLLITKG